MPKIITLDEYLMGRDKKYPVSEELLKSAKITVCRLNLLLDEFKQYRKIVSGYRPEEINAVTPGASKKSNHIICKAGDLEDLDGKLDQFCMKNLKILEQIGLWLEHPSTTSGWSHCQIISPASGNRCFYK